MKRHKTITIESHQVQIIRARSRAAPLAESWCAGCAASTQMVTPEDAARLSGTTTRALYRRVERGELHFVETDAGSLLLCLNSLRA